MSDEQFLQLKLSAGDDAGFTVMFEPSGMTYELEGGQTMSAEVRTQVSNELEIETWSGGISIWAPGPVVTKDEQGKTLHELN